MSTPECASTSYMRFGWAAIRAAEASLSGSSPDCPKVPHAPLDCPADDSDDHMETR